MIKLITIYFHILWVKFLRVIHKLPHSFVDKKCGLKEIYKTTKINQQKNCG